LSQTAASNYPQGSDSPATLDDVQRAHAGFIAQIRDGLPNAQNSTTQLITSITGTNTITGNLSPAITAYATGQSFRFVAAGANTGATTININGVGAKAITKNGATALSSGDIAIDAMITIAYDGTQFQLSSAAAGSFASAGANSDITSLTGLTSVVPQVRQLQPFTAAIASNAITITPSALALEFRNATLTNGAVSFVQGIPTALVIASTDSFGLTTAFGNQRLAILAINNAGTIELAASAIYGGVSLDETGVITTAIASTTATGIKAAAVRTGVAYRIVGFVDATFTTATGWGSLALVQGAGGNAATSTQSLGYGQTWQSVTRTTGNTYYNTTGRPILFSGIAGGASTHQITIGGVSMPGLTVAAGTAVAVTYLIPPGAAYAFSLNSFGSPMELR